MTECQEGMCEAGAKMAGKYVIKINQLKMKNEELKSTLRRFIKDPKQCEGMHGQMFGLECWILNTRITGEELSKLREICK